MKRNLILILITTILITSCNKFEDEYIEVNKFPTVSWVAAADSSSGDFIQNYWISNNKCFASKIDGTIFWNSYWPEAHALDLTIDAYLRTGDSKYKNVIYDWHEGVKEKNWYNGRPWENNYYDDMAWHGLAHMRAFDTTGDTRYEESATMLWEYLTEGWTDYDGGGIQWRHHDDVTGSTDDEATISKGLPCNGPACIIAARRYKKYPNESVNGHTNWEWMNMIYEWMKYNRIELSTGRVYEDINNTNGDYSYDYGTFIGSALELYDITGESMYLNDAIKVANYHIATNINTAYRVMTDYGEQTGSNGDGHDCNLFKGIFVRYFTILIQHPDVPENTRTRYIAFLKNNANYLWFEATEKQPVIKMSPNWWKKPDDGVVWGDVNSAISGGTCIEAMALLEKEGYLK